MMHLLFLFFVMYSNPVSLLSLKMDIFRFFSFQKDEVLRGITLLFFSTMFVFASRQDRLSSNKALTFSETSIIQLDSSSSITTLISKLKNQSFIDFDEEELEWATRLLGWRVFKPGNYSFMGEFSYDNFLSKIALGIQDPVDVVILPGITEQKFVQSISSQLRIDSTSFAKLFSDTVFLNTHNITRYELLGRMLPNTYQLYWTSSPADIINRLLSEFDRLITKKYDQEVQSLKFTLSDILTMASIVEWEAKLEDEKTIIAGLYWNRLKRRMRLEADPTVNFALGERRRLLFEDYKFDHPFNTYLISGLPPAPITNPSESSILAALRPATHGYLYMVANPEGGHEFSTTFEEHQIASDKWRRWLREQYRIKRIQDEMNQEQTN